MKKRYILIAIILFLIIAGKANAAVGDLIYEITNLNINDTENGIKITFEGAEVFFSKSMKEKYEEYGNYNKITLSKQVSIITPIVRQALGKAYEINSKTVTAADEMLQQANNLKR